MKDLNSFYCNKGFPLKKIIEARPKDVSQEAVVQAAYNLWEEIKNGERVVRDIQIPRIIWNKARKLKMSNKKFFVDVVDTKPMVEEVHKEVKEIEGKLKEKVLDVQKETKKVSVKIEDTLKKVENKVERDEFKVITKKLVDDYKRAVKEVNERVDEAKVEILKLWSEKDKLESKLKKHTVGIEVVLFVMIVLLYLLEIGYHIK